MSETDHATGESGPATAKARFTPDMSVRQAMSTHPNVRWVFASYNLGGCSHCAISEEETVAQVAEGYGVPLDRLLEDLNSLFNG